ncbi:MAG TPA: HIT family protein [Flavobacteriales bacterium]|nr:HIT family protein [Flavobacteriales bacterium]
MPFLISRQQAIEKINRTQEEGQCLACLLVDLSPAYTIHKGIYATVVLTEYPRTWGQTMVVLNRHVCSVSETSTAEWQEMTTYIKKTTAILEKTLSPLRCYVAGLGSIENLPMTCPHLHFNILPIYNSNDKPDKIFTWKHGLYDGTEDEWKNLHVQLTQLWDQVTA